MPDPKPTPIAAIPDLPRFRQGWMGVLVPDADGDLVKFDDVLTLLAYLAIDTVVAEELAKAGAL